MKLNDNILQEIENDKYKIKEMSSLSKMVELTKQIDEDFVLDDIDYYQKNIDAGLFLSYLLTVPDQGDEVAGLVILGQEEGGRLWIENETLQPKYRAEGLSRVSMEIIRNIAKENDLRIILVDIEATNDDEQYYYEVLGFEELGKIKHYYEDGKSAIIMGLELE